MATIMAVYNSEGCRGRCDATCHDAVRSACVCICGGRYHGKGQQARELLTEDVLGGNWRERAEALRAEGKDLRCLRPQWVPR